MSNLSNVLGMSAKYVSSNKYNAVTAWSNNGGAGKVQAVGDIVRPTGTSLGLTMTIANPCVLTWLDNGGSALTHNFVAGDRFVFNNNSDTLPSNFAFGTVYYVVGPQTSTFELAATPGGTAIGTFGESQSGTHSGTCINERYRLCYICTVAGTTATSLEPVWPSHLDSSTTRGNTVTDGGVTWQEATGVAILNGDLTHTPNWTNGGAPGSQVYGQVITDNARTHVFICTTNNAAAGGSEPTWNTTTVGNSTTDGSQHWTYLGTVATWQGKQWASPFYSMMDATYSGWSDGTNNGTNNFFVGNSHHAINCSRQLSLDQTNRGAYNQAAQWTCVSESGSTPPVHADVTTGAIEEYAGTVDYTINTGPFARFYGIEIRTSNSAWTYTMQLGYNGTGYFEKCLFNHGGTSGTIQPGYMAEWKNCQIKTANAATNIGPVNTSEFYWHNDDGTTAFAAGSSYPTHLLAAFQGKATIESVDVSATTGDLATFYNSSLYTDVTFRNCKVPTGNAMAIANVNYDPYQRLRIINCDNGAYFNHCETWDYMGYMITDRVAYAASGAAIQSSNFSWLVTTQFALASGPWTSLPISAWNANITGTVTVTLYGACIGTIPTNDEVWLEADYLGSTGSPLSSGISGQCLRLDTAANLSTDTTSWLGGVGARQNSHAYVVGDKMYPTGDSTRVYYCVTAGTSASSEASLYSGAPGENHAVTDGSAHFTSMTRFKVTLSITSYPLVTGLINAIIRVKNDNAALAAAKTYWFDPVLNLS